MRFISGFGPGELILALPLIVLLVIARQVLARDRITPGDSHTVMRALGDGDGGR